MYSLPHPGNTASNNLTNSSTKNIEESVENEKMTHGAQNHIWLRGQHIYTKDKKYRNFVKYVSFLQELHSDSARAYGLFLGCYEKYEAVNANDGIHNIKETTNATQTTYA